MRLIASVGIVAVSIIAQEPKGDARKDPQAAFEPRSNPGAGQKYLERLAGEWDVAKAFYPRAGEPVREVGTCRQVLVQGGKFLQSDFVFRRADGETTGMGLIGFEPDTGKFTSTWIDSRQTRMSLRQSQDPFRGDAIVLYSRTLDPDAKDLRRSRTTSRLSEDDRVLTHRQFSLGPDGEERLMMELVMTRRPVEGPVAAPK